MAVDAALILSDWNINSSLRRVLRQRRSFTSSPSSYPHSVDLGETELWRQMQTRRADPAKTVCPITAGPAGSTK